MKIRKIKLIPVLFFTCFNFAAYAQWKYSAVSPAAAQVNVMVAQVSGKSRNLKSVPASPTLSFFPDTSSGKKNKNCCNSWCFGTSVVPLFNFVGFNSFLMNERVKLTGIRLGVEIGNRVRLGFGYNELKEPIALNSFVVDNDTVSRELKFRYEHFFYEAVFYKNFRWELAVPLSFGRAFGQIDTFSVKNKEKGRFSKIDSTGLFTLGLDAEYRFIPWLGVGAGVGYRRAFAPKYIREKLDAPYYAVKVKIFIGYLFKAVFMKKKLEEERNAYFEEKEAAKKRRAEKRMKKEKGEEVEKVEGMNNLENRHDY